MFGVQVALGVLVRVILGSLVWRLLREGELEKILHFWMILELWQLVTMGIYEI